MPVGENLRQSIRLEHGDFQVRVFRESFGFRISGINVPNLYSALHSSTFTHCCIRNALHGYARIRGSVEEPGVVSYSKTTVEERWQTANQKGFPASAQGKGQSCRTITLQER
jgi:hypothetical protein